MIEEHDFDRPAPGELALVQRLVNTADLDEGTDELTSVEGVRAWVRSAGLSDAALDATGAARVVRLREALRQALLAHNGRALGADAVAELEAVGREVALVVEFGPDGVPRMAPAGSGIDAVLGRLLAIVAHAQAQGTWERLKACPAQDCQWAFYDFSRNHSRTWCDMRVCGNRAKARSYRARQA